MVSATGPTRKVRADAARNRERVLTAAAAVFAERGVDGSIPEIAEHAGVGVATIYRSFPAKRDLVEALAEERLRVFAELCADAAREDDPWGALVALLHRHARRQATDRVLGQVVAEAFDLPSVRIHLDHALDALQLLVERAQSEGDLRPDVTVEDIYVLMSSLKSSVACLDPDGGAAERHMALLIDGLRAPAATTLPHPPLSRERLEELALRMQGAVAGCKRG